MNGFLALWIPQLPWQALRWGGPKPFAEGKAHVVVEARGPAREVIAANTQARRQGVEIGWSEAHAHLQIECWRGSPARALAGAGGPAAPTGLIVHERARALEQRLQAWLGEQLDGVSDRCQWLPDDRWLLNLAGLERLRGDENTIAQRLRERLRAARLHPALGIAGTRSAALLAAQAAASRGGCWVLPRQETAAALGNLPLGVLHGLAGCSLKTAGSGVKRAVEPDPFCCLQLFERWGLKTLRDLAQLPRRGLAERLGEAGLSWQRWARGEDTGLLVPDLKPEPPAEFRQAFDPPLEGYLQLLPWLEEQCQNQCRGLERQDRAIGAIAVELELEAGAAGVAGAKPEWRWEQTYQVPHREAKRVCRQWELAIAAQAPAAAIAAARVRFQMVAPRRMQPRLFGEADVESERTERLWRRLRDLLQDPGGARIGSARLCDVHRRGAFEMAPFQPEDSAVARPPLAHVAALCLKAFRPPRRIAIRFPPLPAPVDRPAGEGALRLEGALCDLPGSATLAVLHASGPWRASGEWWKDTFWSGDEWDVELGDHRLYRLWHDRAARAWFLAGEYD